jgi:hypothetical protein
MMKLILPGAIALVVGIAGGTAIGVMTAPKPAVKTAAASPDSTATASSSHGGAPTGAAPATRAPAVDAVPAATQPSPVVPAPSASPAAGAAPAPPLPLPIPRLISATPTADQLSYKQVARILSNMNPQDAVKILGYLEDSHVEGVLNELGVRQAASLLSQLPTERAARLSERLMRHPPAEHK